MEISVLAKSLHITFSGFDFFLAPHPPCCVYATMFSGSPTKKKTKTELHYIRLLSNNELDCFDIVFFSFFRLVTGERRLAS